MRLFIAIQLSGNVRSALDALIKEFRRSAPGAKWVRPNNLHLTVKFLGATDETKLERIRAALSAMNSSEPIPIDVRGLGFFPNAQRPRVFWAGVEAPASLKSFAGEIDRTLHALGFPREERTFSPHLTIARFNPPGLPPTLADLVSLARAHSFGGFMARDFQLIESKLKSTGAEYTTLQSFNLRN